MPDVLTTKYKFTEPEVGGSDDTWGDKLNANWAKIDDLLGQAFTDGTATDIGVLNPDVLPTSGDDIPYVAKSGDTMVGPLRLSPADGTSGILRISRTSMGANLKNFQMFINASGALVFGPVLDDMSGTTSGFVISRDANGMLDITMVGGTGYSNMPPTDASVLTRIRGDGRYLKIDGGTLTGDLAVNGTISSTGTITASTSEGGVQLGNGGANGFVDNKGPGEFQIRQIGVNRLSVGNDGTVILRRPGNQIVQAAEGAFYFRNAAGDELGRIGSTYSAGYDVATKANVEATTVPITRALIAGNGLTGAGQLNADRTITLGTPSAITADSTNSVTGTSHTHAISSLTVRTLYAQGTAAIIGIPMLMYYSGSADVGINAIVAGNLLAPCNATGEKKAGVRVASEKYIALGTCGPDSSAADRVTLFMRVE